LIGMQEYRPHLTEKGKKDKPDIPKRYFTEIPNEQNKKSIFWGLENVDESKDYLFI